MRLAFVLALALTAVSGCTSEQARDAANSIATDAPAALGDAVLEAKVEAKLVGIDADSALHVAVSVHDGAVRLSGRVKSASTAGRFTSGAKEVGGVKSVETDLKVDANLPPATQQARDAGVVAAVTANLVAQTGVNAIHVKVTAHAGAATLAGTVASAALKSTMLEAARRSYGVKSVVDRLEVAK